MSIFDIFRKKAGSNKPKAVKTETKVNEEITKVSDLSLEVRKDIEEYLQKDWLPKDIEQETGVPRKVIYRVKEYMKEETEEPGEDLELLDPEEYAAKTERIIQRKLRTEQLKNQITQMKLEREQMLKEIRELNEPDEEEDETEEEDESTFEPLTTGDPITNMVMAFATQIFQNMNKGNVIQATPNASQLDTQQKENAPVGGSVENKDQAQQKLTAPHDGDASAGSFSLNVDANKKKSVEEGIKLIKMGAVPKAIATKELSKLGLSKEDAEKIYSVLKK